MTTIKELIAYLDKNKEKTFEISELWGMLYGNA